MKRCLLLASIAVTLTACGSKSPTAPAATTPVATVTRIISIFGAMSFGNVQLGQSATNTLTVQNQGNANLTITGLTGSNGITAVTSASPTSFSLGPGGKQDIAIKFTPAAATTYSGTISVTADQTSGTNTIAFSGAGTLDGIPIFTKSGKGDNVFNLPAYVTRVHVTGHFVNTGSTSNFIATVNGSLLINEILRNADYDGVLSVPGNGLIEIVSSASIQWTFTEVRQ